MSTAESFELIPSNQYESLQRDLEARTENVTIEYDDGEAAHEGLVLRITGNPTRLAEFFRTEHPYIRDYRIVPPGEPPVGSK